MAKFVDCIRCHVCLFDEDAVFVGYDDDTELYLCPDCDAQADSRLDCPHIAEPQRTICPKCGADIPADGACFYCETSPLG